MYIYLIYRNLPTLKFDGIRIFLFMLSFFFAFFIFIFRIFSQVVTNFFLRWQFEFYSEFFMSSLSLSFFTKITNHFRIKKAACVSKQP